MPDDLLVGCALLALALGLLVGLVFWSRRRIERIAARGARTLRETLKGRDGGG